MGVDTHQPPYPTPALADSWVDHGKDLAQTDAATDLSLRTDLTSFALPDDGSPLTLETKKIIADKNGILGPNGQTSLLIEYFEGGKPGDKGTTRPSVRVRVTPGAKKVRSTDAVRITEIGKDRKPSYTKRILLDRRRDTNVFEGTDVSQSSSNLSVRPIEVELLNNSSDLSSDLTSRSRYIHPGSDVSSMPADTMLEGPAAFSMLERQRSRSPERTLRNTSDYHKTPEASSSKNTGQERITQKVLEKLNMDQTAQGLETSGREKLHTSHHKAKDLSDEGLKFPSDRTSLSHEDQKNGTDLGMLKTKDRSSSLSNVSRSSITNPKLLQAVEDAIRRLILPEIETIKRQQSINHGQRRSTYTAQDSLLSGSNLSTEDTTSRLSKAASEPHMKPQAMLDRDVNKMTPSRDSSKRKKHRRSSKDVATERRHSGRNDSLDGFRYREGESRSDRRERRSSRSSADTQDRDMRERRKKRSDGSSRSDSLARTDEEYYKSENIPALPMRSDITNSDITRSSLLSVESDAAETPRPVSRVVPEETNTTSKTSRDSNREAVDSPSAAPRHSPKEKSSSRRSSRSSELRQRSSPPKESISAKAKYAALIAAGLDGAAATRIQPSERQDQDIAPMTQRSSSSRGISYGVLSLEQNPTQSRPDGSSYRRSASNRDNVGEVASPQSSSSKKVSEMSLGSAVSLPTVHRVSPRPRLDDEPPAASFIKTDQYVERDLADDFYHDQHQVNDQYRSELGYDPHSDSLYGAYAQTEESHGKSFLSQVDSFEEERVKNRDTRPEYLHGPEGVESNVASLIEPSLLEPSLLSSQSVRSYNKEISNLHRSNLEGSHHDEVQDQYRQQRRSTERDDGASRERWEALRERARSLSQSPVRLDQNTTREHQRIDDHPDAKHAQHVVDSSRLARLDRPWSGGFDQQSNYFINAEQQGSQQDTEEPHTDYFPRPPGAPTPPHVKADSRLYGGSLSNFSRPPQITDSEAPHETSRQSGIERAQNQPRSPGADSYDTPTPLSFSKPPPLLFNERKVPTVASRGEPEQPSSQYEARKNDNRPREAMSSGYHSASAVQGEENIGSKDVVALMDHLTERDSQRNARDTELLVTLVRSAAEMRNSIYDMKQFIEDQNQINMRNTDAGVNHTVKEFHEVTRQQATSSQRVSRASMEQNDSPVKKRNIFSRALSGLRSKSNNDLSNIEEMLMQLLDEVEELREAQGMARSTRGSVDGFHQRPTESRIMTGGVKAELLPTHEQSGHAISSRRPDHVSAHTGHDNEYSDRRMGVVLEEHEDPYEYEDRRVEREQTPTQQSYRASQSGHANEDRTASDSQEKQSKRSSIFSSLPKISRWSKSTATSNGQESQKDKISSEASRSGSNIDLLKGDQPYVISENDRLRPGNPAINMDDRVQPHSPALREFPGATDDPKFQAQHQALTLQHPQPRPGPTHRHQTHLEFQASGYGDVEPSMSPDSDTLGSVPSLARHPNGAIAGRSVGGAPQEQGSIHQPTRPIVHIPPGGTPQTGSMYAAHNRNLSLHPNSVLPITGETMTTTQPHIPNRSPLRQELNNAGDRASGRRDSDTASSPASPSSASEGDEHEATGWPDDPVIPLPRKRSPYSPGGLLAPIQERYSMEHEREWDAASRRSGRSVRGGGGSLAGKRDSVSSASLASAGAGSLGGGGGGHAIASVGGRSGAREAQPDSPADKRHMLQEEENDLRSTTPQMSPRPALRATGEGDTAVRKITGPREMPRSGSGASSREREGGREAYAVQTQAQTQAEPLRGTVRRKPMPTR